MTSDGLYLIFNADDFGASLETNSRIAAACGSGVVKAVSVLAAEDNLLDHAGFDASVSWGAHLYLTRCRPLSDPLQRLCGPQEYMSKYDLLKLLVTGRITRAQLYAEFSLQLRKIQKNFAVRFIDTHQNVHGLPVIFPVVRRLAAEHNLTGAVRPFVQLNFDLRTTFRTAASRCYGYAAGCRTNARVVVGCPGYEQSELEASAALRGWDRFLSAVKKTRCRELTVPCHPGTSPAETALYGSDAFKRLLHAHAAHY